jgi:hypothetical protein
METEVTKKLFTVDDYYRMGEAGIFGEKARLANLSTARSSR